MNHFETIDKRAATSGKPVAPKPKRHRIKIWLETSVAITIVIAAAEFGPHFFDVAAPPAPPLPNVGVSQPLQRDIKQELNFFGQFAATRSVEIRAQVGRTLIAVNFKDGDIVHQGALLFEIDPVPYQIKGIRPRRSSRMRMRGLGWRRASWSARNN